MHRILALEFALLEFSVRPKDEGKKYKTEKHIHIINTTLLYELAFMATRYSSVAFLRS